MNINHIWKKHLCGTHTHCQIQLYQPRHCIYTKCIRLAVSKRKICAIIVLKFTANTKEKKWKKKRTEIERKLTMINSTTH